MKVLANIQPSDQQLTLIGDYRDGIRIIHGAAGSGKTTTAILRLRGLIGAFRNRMIRLGLGRPIRVAFLTFNRTLRGYVAALVGAQSQTTGHVSVSIQTFSKWAWEILGRPAIISDVKRYGVIAQLSEGLNANYTLDFLVDEVDYVLGRFLPGQRRDYVTTVRTGRGAAPRVTAETRNEILDQLIDPYQRYKAENAVLDWSDLACELIERPGTQRYDIIIVDEAQDFTANQVRAVVGLLDPESYSLTLILDSAQRIYARGFSWQEVGILAASANRTLLTENHRNTREIARFASGIIEGLTVDSDWAAPAPDSCTRTGDLPVVVQGRYSTQLEYVLNRITHEVNLATDSVAFLHPKGWFTDVKAGLARLGIPYEVITKQSDWPEGDCNVALSTLHSSKGLEFDHVFIIGLDNESLREINSVESEDELLARTRRLLAMAVCRAKVSVIIGYRPNARPRLADYFHPDTHRTVTL